ncbi:MAG: thioredoxin family protein [Bacilli bacterium]|nr:thioredoxin family protein [Bacilli bacterium]
MIEIKVIGQSSSNKTKLVKNVNKAIKNLKDKYDITLLEGQSYEQEYGITNTPSLVINDKLISQGKVLTDREIINYIKVIN